MKDLWHATKKYQDSTATIEPQTIDTVKTRSKGKGGAKITDTPNKVNLMLF